MKYFKQLEKSMLESNVDKMVTIINEYMQNEKKIAISTLHAYALQENIKLHD